MGRSNLFTFNRSRIIGCVCLVLISSALRQSQADKIATLVKAANVSVEGYWPSLFTKLCEKRSVEDLITNVGGGKCRMWPSKPFFYQLP